MTGVPYVFASQTATIPLADLDANFNTPVTIGTTTVGLGNSVSSLSNLAAIDFGGTALANYAVGSWTPSDSSGAGLVFTSVSANYTRIGNIVFVYANLNYPATADGSAARIGGLPVTTANQDYIRGITQYAFSTAINPLLLQPIKNTTTVNLISATNAALSGSNVEISFWYPAT